MSWSTDDVVHVRCPRCGELVTVPVAIHSVDVVYAGDHWDTKLVTWVPVSDYTVRVYFDKMATGAAHRCIIAPTDGRMPLDRFIDNGALDSELPRRSS